MDLVKSENINEPKILISPPSIIIWIYGIVLAMLMLGVIYILELYIIAKLAIITMLILIGIGIIRQQHKGNYLVTMQANHEGLYFQTDDYDMYCCIPWSNIGRLEKAVFPLNSRGLRIEVIGNVIAELKKEEYIGNVRVEEGRTYIYTIPQLRDRDRLIKDLLRLKGNEA